MRKSKQYPAASLSLEDTVQPVVADNVVVINMTHGIYALDASNGHELWHNTLFDVLYITVG